MTYADVSEINVDVTLYKSWIWVETPHSAFVLLTDFIKVSLLKLSLRQSRTDMIKYVRLTIKQYCS